MLVHYQLGEQIAELCRMCFVVPAHSVVHLLNSCTQLFDNLPNAAIYLHIGITDAAFHFAFDIYH